MRLVPRCGPSDDGLLVLLVVAQVGYALRRLLLFSRRLSHRGSPNGPDVCARVGISPKRIFCSLLGSGSSRGRISTGVVFTSRRRAWSWRSIPPRRVAEPTR